MFKKIFESCEDSIVKRVSNPYFGTYIAVLLIDNWELIYTLFTFSSYETRDTRISIIADYISREGGLSWLFAKCALIAFIPFIIYYILLNASGYISNWFELRLKPWLLKQVDKGLVVDKVEYDKLASRITTLQTKVDDERKKRMEAEDERDTLSREIKKLSTDNIISNENKDTTASIHSFGTKYQKTLDYFLKRYNEPEFSKFITQIRGFMEISNRPLYNDALLYGLIEIQGGKVAFTDFGNNLVNQFVDFNN